MNWLEALVKRPVAVTVAVIVALLLGSMALARLSIDLLPNLNLPYAAVITSYQGAGPEEIEKAVTRPLEDVLGTVQGVKNILSYSMSGTSIVLLEFEWGQDMDFAALNMREKVDQVERFLPDAAEKPTVVKFDPNMMPVMTLALYGDMDEERLKDLAENTVKGRLERLNGVAAVNITGGWSGRSRCWSIRPGCNFTAFPSARWCRPCSPKTTPFPPARWRTPARTSWSA